MSHVLERRKVHVSSVVHTRNLRAYLAMVHSTEYSAGSAVPLGYLCGVSKSEGITPATLSEGSKNYKKNSRGMKHEAMAICRSE
jgi:hypothetical protein